jgi:hypothetical protein
MEKAMCNAIDAFVSRKKEKENPLLLPLAENANSLVCITYLL